MWNQRIIHLILSLPPLSIERNRRFPFIRTSLPPPPIFFCAFPFLQVFYFLVECVWFSPPLSSKQVSWKVCISCIFLSGRTWQFLPQSSTLQTQTSPFLRRHEKESNPCNLCSWYRLCFQLGFLRKSRFQSQQHGRGQLRRRDLIDCSGAFLHARVVSTCWVCCPPPHNGGLCRLCISESLWCGF